MIFRYSTLVRVTCSRGRSEWSCVSMSQYVHLLLHCSAEKKFSSGSALAIGTVRASWKISKRAKYRAVIVYSRGQFCGATVVLLRPKNVLCGLKANFYSILHQLLFPLHHPSHVNKDSEGKMEIISLADVQNRPRSWWYFMCTQGYVLKNASHFCTFQLIGQVKYGILAFVIIFVFTEQIFCHLESMRPSSGNLSNWSHRKERK